jgi:hypothetical protein
MLTRLQITSAKPKAKPYNLTDGQGLVLVVQATGSKLWRFRYRFAGQQKTLHLGPWPTVSLADARERCREARKAIESSGPGRSPPNCNRLMPISTMRTAAATAAKAIAGRREAAARGA